MHIIHANLRELVHLKNVMKKFNKSRIKSLQEQRKYSFRTINRAQVSLTFSLTSELSQQPIFVRFDLTASLEHGPGCHTDHHAHQKGPRIITKWGSFPDFRPFSNCHVFRIYMKGHCMQLPFRQQVFQQRSLTLCISSDMRCCSVTNNTKQQPTKSKLRKYADHENVIEPSEGHQPLTIFSLYCRIIPK